VATLAALVLLGAAPALADPGDRPLRDGAIRLHDRHDAPLRLAHGRAHRHHESRGHRVGRHHGHGHGWVPPGHRRGRGHAGGRHRHEVVRPGWFCGPCASRFGTSARFHRHLHFHHGVPWHRIPRVMVRIDLGWIFPG
jgi:hypothetical protein